MRSLTLAVLGCVLSPLAAQQTFVVDPNGSTAYKTIASARNVARSGDTLQLMKGVYTEDIYLNGISLNVMGIAPNVSDVVIQPYGISTSLRLFFHPAGQTSRFSRFVVDNSRSTWSQTVHIEGGRGTIICEQIECRGQFSAKAFRGELALHRCLITGGHQRVLTLEDVTNAFVHDCDLLPGYRNSWFPSPIVHPSTIVVTTTVEFSHCRMRGTLWGTYSGNYTPGGPALILHRANARITGLTSDSIVGGDGHTGTPVSSGGSAIVAISSTVTLAGIKVAAGAGLTPPAIVNTNSSVNRLSTMAPVVSVPGGMARGTQAVIDVYATPLSSSLTWIALEFTPIPTPFGTLVIDPGRPSIPLAAAIGPTGRVSFPVDLRSVPASLVGVHYVIQTASSDPMQNLRLSGPCIGIVGN